MMVGPAIELTALVRHFSRLFITEVTLTVPLPYSRIAQGVWTGSTSNGLWIQQETHIYGWLAHR